MKKLYVKNLSNKFPSKDITEEDILFKLKKICSKKKEKSRSKIKYFSIKKISQLLLVQMELIAKF